MTAFSYLKDVTTIELDTQKCVGCGMCTTVCPQSVFEITNGRAIIRDRDACMECGACALNCPAEAISVDVGVGCAAAVINAALGRQNSGCCCIIEDKNSGPSEVTSIKPGKSSCC